MKQSADKRTIDSIQMEASRILTAESRLHTLSWTRIEEISQHLTDKDLSREEVRAYADELAAIAEANQAVAARLEHYQVPAASGSANASPAQAGVPTSAIAVHEADVPSSATCESEAKSKSNEETPAEKPANEASAATSTERTGKRPRIDIPEIGPVHGEGARESDSLEADTGSASSDPTDSAAVKAGAAPSNSDGAGRKDRFPWSRRRRFKDSATQAEQGGVADAFAGSTADVAAERTGIPASGKSEEAERESSESATSAVIADSNRQASSESEEDGSSAKLETHIHKNGRQDDTAPVNVLQMLNAEMAYQTDDERAKDRYAAAAAQASLYDDPVTVVFPEDEDAFEYALNAQAKVAERLTGLDKRSGAGDCSERPVYDEQDGERAAAPISDGVAGTRFVDAEPATDASSAAVTGSAAAHAPAKFSAVGNAGRTGKANVRTTESDSTGEHDRMKADPNAQSAPGAGGTAPANPKPAEGEESIVVEVSPYSRAERALMADRKRKERKKEQHKGRFSHLLEHKTDAEAADVVIPRGKATEAPGDLFFEKPVDWERSTHHTGQRVHRKDMREAASDPENETNESSGDETQ